VLSLPPVPNKLDIPLPTAEGANLPRKPVPPPKDPKPNAPRPPINAALPNGDLTTFFTARLAFFTSLPRK
jgi:hypothetical protein